MIKIKICGNAWINDKTCVCDRMENTDKGAIAMERARDSDIALDAIAISHHRNGWGIETTEYD